MTIGHVADIVRASGSEAWEALNPAQSPIRLIYVMAAFIADATNQDVIDVLTELRTLKFRLMVEALGFIDDED